MTAAHPSRPHDQAVHRVNSRLSQCPHPTIAPTCPGAIQIYPPPCHRDPQTDPTGMPDPSTCRPHDAMPLAAVAAPTGRGIPTRGATPGPHGKRALRSEGTPHRDRSGTRAPYEDMRRSYRTRPWSHPNTRSDAPGWYAMPRRGILGAERNSQGQDSRVLTFHHWPAAAVAAPTVRQNSRGLSSYG